MPKPERFPTKHLCHWCRTNEVGHCAAWEDMGTSHLFSELAAELALLNNPNAVPEALEMEKLEAAWPEVKEIIETAHSRGCRWIK